MKFCPTVVRCASVLFLVSGLSAKAPVIAAVEAPDPVEFSKEELIKLYPRLVVSPVPIPDHCLPESTPTPEQSSVNAMSVERFLAEKARAAGLQNNPRIQETVRKVSDQAVTLFLRYSVEAGIEITEEEIRAFHADHSVEFESPELIRADYFFAEVTDPSEDLKKRKLLERTLADAGAGRSIRELKATAETKGLIVSKRPVAVVRGRFSPTIEDTLFSAGRIGFTDIIRTQHGWHLFHIESHRPRGRTSLDEARNTIHKRILGKRSETRREEILLCLRKRYPLDIKETDSSGVLRGAVAGRTIAIDAATDGAHTELNQRADSIRLIAWALACYGDGQPDLAALRELLVNNTLASAFLESIRDRISITDDELRKEYSANAAMYVRPEEKHVWELLVPIPKAGPDESFREVYHARRDLRDEVGKLRETVVSSAQPLNALQGLKLRSSSWRVENRGMDRMGPRGRVLDMATQSLVTNGVSEVVESGSHYHFFVVTEVRPAIPLSFDESLDRATQTVRIRKWLEETEAEICTTLEAVQAASTLGHPGAWIQPEAAGNK